MARLKTSQLSNKTKRLTFDIRIDPYFESLSEGTSIGYRRNQTAGSWVARRYVNKKRMTKNIGTADDFKEADGYLVLSYAQACKMALDFNPERDERDAVAKADAVAAWESLTTVRKALDLYEADLKVRGGDVYNAKRLHCHVDAEMGSIRVKDLTKAGMKEWRDGLIGKLSPTTINRNCNSMKAALNLVADQAPNDDPISREPWEYGLKSVGGSGEGPRNVILPHGDLKKIVAACYGLDAKFGELCEGAAVTGARYSQINRAKVRDLMGGEHDPKIMMPRSNKGRMGKNMSPIPTPISQTLAAKLWARCEGAAPDDLLFIRTDGGAWEKSAQCRHFWTAVQAAYGWEKDGEQKPMMVGNYKLEEITMYAFRHSSIVRQLLKGVPTRVVASHHDTSVAMIEKHYSAYITDHADLQVRGALESF